MAGIKTWDTEGNSCIVSSRKQVQTALAEHWAPIYAQKVFGRGAAEMLLADYQNRNAELIANFSRCELPKKERFVAIIKKVKDSPPGPMEFLILPMLLALTSQLLFWRIRQNYLEERLSLAMLR